MAKTYYYAIVNKNGNLVCLEGNLPVYWNKGVAISECISRCSEDDEVVRIRISDLEKLLTPNKLAQNN
jgi:hypothetical protein